MEQNPKNLDLKSPFIITLAIFVSLFIFLGIFAKIDQARKNQVLSQYQEETLMYIAKNREGLETIFTSIFPQESCRPWTDDQCAKPEQEDIMKLISNDLLDFSSVMFLKKISSGELIYLRLSGEYGDAGLSPEDETKILQLLNGNISSVPWDDYFFELRGKEVVVPVSGTQGQILGAIVRGSPGR